MHRRFHYDSFQFYVQCRWHQSECEALLFVYISSERRKKNRHIKWFEWKYLMWTWNTSSRFWRNFAGKFIQYLRFPIGEINAFVFRSSIFELIEYLVALRRMTSDAFTVAGVHRMNKHSLHWLCRWNELKCYWMLFAMKSISISTEGIIVKRQYWRAESVQIVVPNNSPRREEKKKRKTNDEKEFQDIFLNWSSW